MRIIEHFLLKKRANKYRFKNDRGGIAYILSAVKSGETVLDIGAHKAGYLYFILKQVGLNGKVYAFEPQLKLFNYLNKMKKLFKWENVTIENLALSDSSGKVTLFVPVNKVSNGSSPGATILQKNNISDIGFTETVNTITIDEYCSSQLIQPNLLKIDVEGNEMKVLKGGIKTLEKFKPKIIIEIEERHIGKEKMYETFEFLKKLGYTGYFIHDADLFPLASFTIEAYQNPADSKNSCNNFIFE